MTRLMLLMVGTASLVITSTAPLESCIAHSGIMGGGASAIDEITSSVSVSSAYIAVADELDYIVDDIEYVRAQAGPVVLHRLGEEDLKDDILVNRLNEEVRAQVQSMVHDLLRIRRSAWMG